MYKVNWAVTFKLSPSPPVVQTVVAGSRVQSGLRQHVHQDLVGPHTLHQEGGEEGEEEGRLRGQRWWARTHTYT